MTNPVIDGFEYRRLPGAGGIEVNAAVGGSGEPVVLLHGFPQTHLMWRHVARLLAADHTVVVPDLRGYGASDAPPETGPEIYAKRTMAADIVEAMVRSATSASGSSDTIAARWSGSAPRWIIPNASPTWASSMCCRPWTPGPYCTASTRRSPGTCT
ncbi:alpha/beta fold hydrolase [Nocardia sp. NPDC055321]